MSMSAFAQRDDDGAPAALESQQAKLLESLRAAEGQPVSYGELQQAGIELPASVVSELELAGVPIVRCSLGQARGAGVRLERTFDAGGVLAATAEATGPPADAFVGERAHERLVRLVGGAVGRACAAVGAVTAWAICVGPPAARCVGRWLLSTARKAGERARRLAQHASSAGARRSREAAAAFAAWRARVLLPATRRTADRLGQLAHRAGKRASGGGERVERWGRTTGAALTRAAAAVPPGLRAANRMLAATSQALAELARGSIAEMRAAENVHKRPTHNARQQSASAYPPQTPLHAAAILRPPATHQTRNRCLAFGALAGAFCVVLAVVLSNLSASAGDAQRPAARHYHSRGALPNAARAAPPARAASTSK